MHGRICKERKKGLRRHMLTAPTRVPASVEADGSSSLSLSSSTSFCKDGRKISVGDCALFKPPQDCQDCPPFIGIIRLVIAERENKIKLGVNWLYRPAELKLGKGVLLEAAPNEIFYSFHEDEIPAASLLHPCKVAFLPKGVELPSGICSFVCRRVYDVTYECLWWLTDQDYVDDRQQEVDQLLCKTRSEMHTTLQQGGRSPKSMNSPTTSQLKPGTDNTQNNTPFSSQGKGRKRERMDYSSESIKRERSSPLRTEGGLKSDIAKITEKGGLVDSDGVEKLVQLMLLEKNEKKIDLICRSMLAGVIAATDKYDCLSRFIQLKGLPVFDEWLLEVHKGKIGEGSSPKDNDRTVEDFLLILLRALDKLPVNLNALQTCNIGKSVNHLRSHKNSEIQKKARSIVDTWKKRVEAEMDAKSGSNHGASLPGRPRHSEVSHGGRHSSGSADATRTTATHLHASKSASVKTQAEGCSNKLIVKLPNRGRSPAQSVSGGSFEDPTAVNSRASSPLLAEKHDQFDRNNREKNDAYRANFISDVNAESWQSNDFKDVLTGLDEAAASPSMGRTVDDSKKAAVAVKATSPSSGAVKSTSPPPSAVKATSPPPGNELKAEKRNGGSFSSMNALIESCVRYSETNACMAGADDVGMNLLASVAADEMSKSHTESPSASQISNTLVTEKNNAGNHAKLVALPRDGLPHDQHQAITSHTNGQNDEHDKHVCSSSIQGTESENVNEIKPGDVDESSNSEIEDLQRLVDQCLESNENSDDVASTPLATTGNDEKTVNDSESKVVDDQKADCASDADRVSDTTKKIGSSVPSECETVDKVDALGTEQKEQKPHTRLTSEFVKKVVEDASVNVDRLITKTGNDTEANHISQTDKTMDKHDHDASISSIKMHVTADPVPKRIVEHVEENAKKADVNGQSSGAIALPVVSPTSAGDLGRPYGNGDEAEECTSVARESSSVSASAGLEMDARVEFDLNEGFNGDDARIGDLNNVNGSVSFTTTTLQPVNTLPFPAPCVSSGHPASITVAAAAKGPFVPPDDLLKSKGTVGWKGSAATSAFRPAEPRKVQEAAPLSLDTSSSTTPAKQTRMLLDIDLNVPDERVLEDLASSQRSWNVTNSTPGLTDNIYKFRCGATVGSVPAHSSGGLDLDLNKVDDPADVNSCTIGSGCRLDISFQQAALPSGGRRDFDLNDGPAVNDMDAESSTIFNQHSRNSLPSQPAYAGIRANGENISNFSSWFPTTNSYSAVSIPPIMSERGEQQQPQQPFPVIVNGGSQRMMGPTTGVSSFTHDLYRGPVLSSSPAVPYQPTAFQYPPVFPFGTSFPLASATTYMDSSPSGRFCFPSINSQNMGPAVAVPSNYPRPYIVGLPNGSSSSVLHNSGKWLRSGLDLNSGPGGHETEGREESAAFGQRQLPSTSQSMKDEQSSRMYQKRKEPDGGWDGYKQSSRQ